MVVHKHGEVICAWAQGKDIQYNSRGMWEDFDSKYDPNWGGSGIEWRIKPAEPEWPVTQMTNEEIQRLLVQNRGLCESVVMARIVADASLRHACDNGQIVTREEFDLAITDRKERDMAVAIAIRNFTIEAWLICGLNSNELKSLSLEAIIAEVK